MSEDVLGEGGESVVVEPQLCQLFQRVEGLSIDARDLVILKVQNVESC